MGWLCLIIIRRDIFQAIISFNSANRKDDRKTRSLQFYLQQGDTVSGDAEEWLAYAKTSQSDSQHRIYVKDSVNTYSLKTKAIAQVVLAPFTCS